MKKITSAFVLLLISLPGIATGGSGVGIEGVKPYPAPLENPREWSDVLHLQMLDLLVSQNLPNAVAALASSREIHFLEGYGFADMASEIPVDPQKHLFRTGSVAKIFTWSAIMQLYEEGKIDLNDDISNYLDLDLEFRVAYKTDNPEPITFIHLLTHTAGFEDILDGLFTFEPQPPLANYLMQRVPARIFPPGEVMAYSNYGTVLAGYIVEHISGMAFETYVKNHIFSPLGMQKSTFEQPPPGELADRLVNPYRWVDGQFLQGRFEHMPGPAGGLSTTAKDMALFLQAHLGRGSNAHGTFLQEETLKRMHQPLFSHHPLLGGMTHGFKEFTTNGLHVIFHGGSSSVFDAGFYLIPELDLGLFIAYSGGSYSGHKQVLRALLNFFYPVEDDMEALRALADTLTPVPGAPDITKLPGEYFQSRTIVTGPDKVLNLIMGTLIVTSVDNVRFSVSILGQQFDYEQMVPGIYRNTKETEVYPFGPLRYLVAGRAPDGRLMLAADGPMTYIRAPWYGGSVMAMIIFVPALLLATGSLVFLFTGLVFRKVRRRSGLPSHRKSAGHRLLIAHAVSLLGMVFLVMLYGNPHPVHLLPESAFTGRGWVDVLLDAMPFLVAFLGLAVIWTTIASWKRRDRSILSRIHYSAYAVWSFGLIWFFLYWGMLGF